MTTLLNSFAHARHAVFVSGFVRNEMSHYITHLASGIEKDYVPRAKLVEGHQEVVFVDVLKIEQNISTDEEFLDFFKDALKLPDVAFKFYETNTGTIGQYSNQLGQTLTVVAASNYIKKEAEKTKSNETTVEGYLHYMLSVCAAKTILATDEAIAVELASKAVLKKHKEQYGVVFYEISSGIPTAKLQWLLNCKLLPLPNTNLDVSDFVGGGYGYVPANNPYVDNGLTQSDTFLVDFTSANADVFLMVGDVDYDVNLTLKHQPDWVNCDHFSNVYDEETGKHLIIYVKCGSALKIADVINKHKARFIPGRFGDQCHIGTFRVDGKHYEVRTVTPEHTGFMEDLYNMADTNAELVYIGLHLMYLLQKSAAMIKKHETKQFYLAFNAIEKLTCKPFHAQEWLLKHLGDGRFDAIKLRHQYNFPI